MSSEPKYYRLDITNTVTDHKQTWSFKAEYRGLVYEEIRKATYQQKDLSIVLDTSILIIPATVMAQSILTIYVIPPLSTAMGIAPLK